jgi:NAD(P)-dependent dehydrogenase (short-subunit alcohol dehydrogenase family)
MDRFRNQVVVVTGGGSGIGRAAALRFASEGARVVIADINSQGSQSVVKSISDSGGEAVDFPYDVSDEVECQRIFSDTEKHFGRVDVVFANAGITGGGLLENLPVEDWDRVIRVNLRGVFLTCKYAIPLMIRSRGRAIVTMGSSMAGWDTSLDGSAYMASKEGVVGLTKNLALQLARYQIRVNAICPGVIQTTLGFDPDTDPGVIEQKYVRFKKRIPLRRVGQPDDVAAAVAFLASDDARYITGASLLIDGGQTLQSWSNAPEEDAFPLDFEINEI